MATNGFLYTHGHKTSASPSWCDAVLQGSNNVRDVCAWTTPGTTTSRMIAYATDADVVLVNDSTATQVGYASRSGGFRHVAKVGEYLYLGVDGGGVYRLALPEDLTTANGDITPSSWTALYRSSTTPALFSDNVVDLYGWTSSADGDAWLAVACCDNAALGNDRVTVINMTEGAAYDSAVWCFADDLILKGHGGAQFYVAGGNFLNVVYDAEAIDADDWWFDCTVAGSFADDFADNELVGWNKYANVSGCMVVEQNQRLEMVASTATNGVVGSARTLRTGMFAGDFDVSLKCVITSDSANLATGRMAGNSLTIFFPQEASAASNWWRTYVNLERRILKGSFNRLYTTYATEATTDQYNVDFTPTTWWWRIARVGGAITTYYKQSMEASWTQFHQFTGGATSPGLIELVFYTDDAAYNHEGCFDDLATGWSGLSSCYSSALPKEKIADFAPAPGTSVAGTTTAVLGFGAGVWLADTDESSHTASEDGGNLRGAYTSASGGGLFPVLAGSSDAATAVACTTNAKMIVGTSMSGAGSFVAATAAGISAIDLSDDSLAKHLSADYAIGEGQPLVGDQVHCLTRCGSYAYGASAGGGWFEPDATAVADTILNGRHFAGDKVSLAWATPVEADWLYSRLYRRGLFAGSGAWQQLKADGFGGGGAAIAFDGTEDGSLAYYDTSIDTDDHYEYKVTQVDEAGNESTGATFAAYCDEPVIAAVTIRDPSTGETGTTSSRGVLVEVVGHSGPDSRAPHAVECIQIKEGAASSYTNSPFMRYAEGASYPFTLSENNGSKTVYVRGYSQAGEADMTGASDGSASITLLRQYAPATRPPTTQSMVLAYDFLGDGAVVTDFNGNEKFPPANVLNPDLGVKWQAADNDAHLDFDLIGMGGYGYVVKYVAIAGHNFNLFAGSNFSLRIRYKQLPGETFTNVDISALASNDLIVVDMQTVAARYVRLDMSFSGTTINNFAIGRVMIVSEGARTIQPTANFRRDVQWGATAQYTAFHETAATRFAANHRHPRTVEIALDDFPADDRRKLFAAYEFAGRHQPVLWLGKPEILPTRAAPDWTQPDDAERANNFTLYGYFDDERQTWTMAANELGRTTLRLREAVE